MARKSTPPDGSPRTVAVLCFEGAAVLDITGPHEVFAMANRLAGEESQDPPYRLLLLADAPGPLATVSGLSLVADASWHGHEEPVDTLVVSGGPGHRAVLANKPLLSWLGATAKRVRRVASICTGAFLLAEAGLLDGQRAATHWKAAQELARGYPRVSVQPDAIFVRDGSFYSSAGVTAGMDLALALVEEDLGHEAALAVARMLVLYLKRPGGQSQFGTELGATRVEGGRLSALLGWIRANYRLPLTVEVMAERAAMSPRNFARAFVAETGTTPARHVEQLRLEQALRCLSAAALPVDVAARDCGFNGPGQLRRAFQRHLGITPQEYRERFRSTGIARDPS